MDLRALSDQAPRDSETNSSGGTGNQRAAPG
jgi:hypothetical protein